MRPFKYERRLLMNWRSTTTTRRQCSRSTDIRRSLTSLTATTSRKHVRDIGWMEWDRGWMDGLVDGWNGMDGVGWMELEGWKRCSGVDRMDGVGLIEWMEWDGWNGWSGIDGVGWMD